MSGLGGVGGPVAATAGALASLGGSLYQTNEQERMMREQQQFSLDASGSEMQRRVADLRAAGLNPMLGYTQGGASAPGVGMSVSPSNPASGMTSSAFDGMRLMSELATQAAQRKLLDAQEDKARSDAESNRAGVPLKGAQTQVALSQVPEAQKRMELMSAQTASEQERVRNLQTQRDQMRWEISKLQTEIPVIAVGGQYTRALEQLAQKRKDLVGVETQLGQYQLPAARNSAEVQDDDFQRSVVPRLNSAVSGLVGGLSGWLLGRRGISSPGAGAVKRGPAVYGE